MKTIEQERGALLAERLQLLNDFLISGTEKSFEQFISDKLLTVEDFLKPLPDDFKFLEIGQSVLADEDSKETLTDYTEDLNVLYFEQYLAHQDAVDKDEFSADGGDDDENEDETSDVEWYELSKSERKRRRAEKKAAKQEKKTERKDAKKTGRQERRTARKSGATKAQRRADRKNRKADIKAAQAAKKAEKKRLKEALKRGEITRKQFREGKQTARKAFRGKVGSGIGRALGRLNKFNPAFLVMRKAYNSVLRLNIFNQAKRLGEMADANGEDWKKALKIWDRFGGSPSGFRTPIAVGRIKRPILGKKGSRKNADGSDDENYNSTGGDVALIIGSAAALIGSFAGLISSSKKDKGETLPEGEDPDEDGDFPPDPYEDVPEGDNLDDELDAILSGEDEDDDEGGFVAKNKGLLWGALGLAIAGIIAAFAFGGKKKAK